MDDGGQEWDLTPGVEGTRLEYRVPQKMTGDINWQYCRQSNR